MKIVTFNVRCVWKGRDGQNSFVHRAGLIYEKLQEEKPDVISFQEIKAPQLDILEKVLPEYEFFGTLRSKDYTGEGVYTAIRKETCVFLGNEVFWLSPTPFVAGSKFERQSEYPRICAMSKIRNKATNEVFRVYNLHLDHVSDEARNLGVRCAFEFMDEYDEKEKLPSVLLGDFNALPQDGVMQFCRNRQGITDATEDIPFTYHGFGTVQDKIDYIFVTDEWKERVEKTVAWTDSHAGIYLSDHYPVCLQIKDYQEIKE